MRSSSSLIDNHATNKRRKPLRAELWDYSQPAIYHITICVQDRESRFGVCHDSLMDLSAAGLMVEEELLALPDRFPEVGIDTYVIMPNHIHFLIEMNLRRKEAGGLDLSRPIQAFKSLTTRRYSQGVREQGWPPYDGILWQKRYYETIMRNDKWLARHREYLLNNPAQWADDPERFHKDSSIS